MVEICARCGTFGDARTVLNVHCFLPQTGWKGGDKDGHILLCDRCHLILYVLLFSEVGKWVKSGDSWEKMREKIKTYTAGWILNANSPK